MSRIRYGGTPGAGDGKSTPDSYVPEGFSLDKAYQDQEPSGTIRKRTSSGAGKDGLNVQEGEINYYKIEDRNPEPSNPVQSPGLEEEEAAQLANIQLSERAAAANAGTDAYEQVLLNKQGNATIKGDLTPEQQFKDQYQLNLTNELKVQSPSTLQAKKAEIALADQQTDEYSLELGGRR